MSCLRQIYKVIAIIKCVMYGLGANDTSSPNNTQITNCKVYLIWFLYLNFVFLWCDFVSRNIIKCNGGEYKPISTAPLHLKYADITPPILSTELIQQIPCNILMCSNILNFWIIFTPLYLWVLVMLHNINTSF